MKNIIRASRNAGKKTQSSQAQNGNGKMQRKPRSSGLAELKIVRLRECPMQGYCLDTPAAVENVWRLHVESSPRFNAELESMWVFSLNARKGLKGFEQLSQGTKDTLLVDATGVFRLASIQNAAGIVIAHNHPSGNPLPSDADIKTTRDLIQVARMMKIEFVDHVIIGASGCQKGYASLRELGYFYTADLPGKNGERDRVRDVRDAAEEISQAATQSNVLMELVESHLDYREHRGGEDFTGERADTFNFGLWMLAKHTRARLQKAAKKIMAAAYDQKPEAV